MTAPTRDVIIREAISTDAAFAGRFISSLGQAREVAPAALFCMFNYLSLFAYESHARLKKMSPSLSAGWAFSNGAADLLARSRHSLKLFEDTKRGVQGQLEFFANEVGPAHRRAFIEPVRLPFASAWKTDLGLTLYRGRLVTSTFATTFTLGYPPEKLLLDGTGEALKRIAQEFGAYFAGLGAMHDPGARSFASALNAVDIVNRDVRSASWYRNGFNGELTPAINMLLGTFQGLVNTCDQLLCLDVSEASRQTIFKLRYLTVYQVLRSLEILKSEHSHRLTTGSHSCIDALLADPEAMRLVDPAKKPLRNTLMHYGPDRRIALKSLVLDRPLYGMIEQVFRVDYDDMEERLAGLSARVAEGFNQWSTRR